MSAPRLLPTTAGALLVDGAVHAHTAVRGDVAPELHPLVRRFLHELPTYLRERYAGWCAETVLVSDRFYAMERLLGGTLSASQARSALSGARLSLSRVREAGDPAHGTPQPACRSCAALLEWCGVELVQEDPVRRQARPAAGADGAGRPGPELARRWALALASYAAPDGRRHDVVPPAVEAYGSVGGARGEPDGPGEEVAPSGFVVDPMRALHTVATLDAFGAVLGVRLSPLGVEGDGAGLLAIDERGRVFVLDATAEWFLGDAVREALRTLTRGRAPARVRQDGTWN